MFSKSATSASQEKKTCPANWLPVTYAILIAPAFFALGRCDKPLTEH
jgi:hypothetical protein